MKKRKTATQSARRRLAVLALALGGLWLATPAPAAAQPPKAKTNVGKSSAKAPVQKSAEPARQAASARGDGFQSEGRFVRVDTIKADSSLRGEDGRAPAVLILHGAHGLGDGSLFYPQAKALAEAGISAFVVHYFDGIGDGRKASPQLYDRREKIISDAVSYVARQNYVDAEKIGVFGLSLGGFHALALGSHDSRVQAVVNVVGAMPADVERRGVDRMPPTLVLHGDKDRTVPVARAYQLASLLKSVGAEHEVKIYSGEGHSFRQGAKEDSILRTVAFFERHFAVDRGLLDKPVEFDISLAPVVPEEEMLPIRQLTVADEAMLSLPGDLDPGHPIN